MRFLDLTPVQCRVMIRIEGWSSDGVSIGVPEDNLPGALLEAAIQLERLDLARVETGWLGSRWWRLTERGRAIREWGEA